MCLRATPDRLGFLVPENSNPIFSTVSYRFQSLPFNIVLHFGAMIHLDHNHHHTSPLPNSKQNLILPTTHSDHNILSWSALSHDDQPFPHQEDYISDSVTAVQPELTPTNESSATDTISSRPGPITPVDANDPVLLQTSGPSSPGSPADGNSASPTGERTSSLSPPPDTDSSRKYLEPRSSPPPPSIEDNEVSVEATEENRENETREEKSSRQSTPLSELSPPPDQEDDGASARVEAVKPEEVTGQAAEKTMEELESGVRENAETGPIISDATEAQLDDVVSNPNAATPTPSAQSTDIAQASSTVESGPDRDSNPEQSPNELASTFTSSLKSPTNSYRPSIESPATLSVLNPVASPTHSKDSKIVSILELNVELLK